MLMTKSNILVEDHWLQLGGEVRQAEAVVADASELRQTRRGKDRLLLLYSGVLKEARLSPGC